ncbi:MAG: hypothetical protein RIR69_114 [Actinomycetota bacterium]
MIRQFLFSSHTQDQRVIVEAIASWTENLRDVISASSGLHEAVITTSQCPPQPIADAVQRLAAALRYQPLEVSLREFADEVAHPTCDFVVAALIIASQNQARDIALLLSHLAECARSECDLYLRVWVSRARSRTAVRIVTGAVVFFFSGIMLFSSSYLQPFLSIQGLCVLAGIIAVFVVSIRWMTQIAHIELPQRFLAIRQSTEVI